MPIGKNAIKRITNNGYSNVKTSAPDMENSVVEEKDKTVAKKAVPSQNKSTATKKTATQKTATQKTATQKPSSKPQQKNPTAPKKSLEKEPELSPVKTAEKITKKQAKSQKDTGFDYINLGRGELPYYLL